MPGSGFPFWRMAPQKPACAQDVKSPKHACGTYGTDANARQKQSREGPAAQPRHRGWHYQILKSAFELGRPGRSADPDSHIAPTAQEPPPAAIIVVVGVSAEATKAAAEIAADVADAVKAAMDVADTVDAAMEHVSTAVTAVMSASMSTARGRDGRR